MRQMRFRWTVIILCMIVGLILINQEYVAAEKQPMPNAEFNASDLTLSQLRVGYVFSFDGGSNWSLIQDSWMNSITLSENDVNNALAHGILVKMTGDGVNTFESDVLCIVLNKANTPNNVQTVAPTDNGNSGKITNVNQSMQYKKETDGNWSDVPDTTISNLAPGTYQIRTKGSGTTLASDTISVTINPYDPTKGLPRQPIPGANFDAHTMMLSNITGVNYSLNGGNNWITANADQVTLNLADLHPENGIKLYRPGNGSTNADSEIQTINLSKATPPIGISALSATENAQGIMNGVSPQMEYMPQGANTWSNITSYQITVPAGVYFVRTQGAYTTLPSDAVEVMIDMAQTPVESAPVTVTDEEDQINDLDNSEASTEIEEAEAPKEFVRASVTGPSIVDQNNIRGWDAIIDHITDEPMCLNMNGTTEVPMEALKAIKQNDSELILGMDDRIFWDIKGDSIIEPKDINLAVLGSINAVDDETLKTLESDRNLYHQFSLVHDGNFGFTGTLTIFIDNKDAGKYANLFYYHSADRSMEYVDTCMIDATGNANFIMNHASSYVITVNRVKYTGGTTSNAHQIKPVSSDKVFSGDKQEKAPIKWIAAFVALILLSLFAIILVLKRETNKNRKRKHRK